MNFPWLKRDNEALSLALKVKPASKQNAIFIDEMTGLQVLLKAQPQNGKANKMLVQYLAKTFHLQQSQIVITRGAASRLKILTLKIAAKDQEDFLQALEALK